ncbi:MAG: ion transporter [Pseudomonadota bacterium]
MAVDGSSTDIGLRRRVYRELEPGAQERDGLSRTNMVIVLLVMASFIAVALETEPSLPPGWARGIELFNLAILAIFAAEYAVRVWASSENPRLRGPGGKLRYMTSPSAIADLIAFLPELLWLVFIGAEGEETLMMLRVLRLARLVKIARFMPAFDVLGAALARSRGQLLTTLAVAMALVYVAAVALYFIEGVVAEREAFASIPRAIWWAIATLTTVGYGDIYPQTVLGRIAASVIALAGIGVVALPAGVFASAFSDELRARDTARRNRRAAAGKPPPGDEGRD